MGKQCVCLLSDDISCPNVLMLHATEGPEFKLPNAGACSRCSAPLTITTRAGAGSNIEFVFFELV
jgi:hypothetical protein